MRQPMGWLAVALLTGSFTLYAQNQQVPQSGPETPTVQAPEQEPAAAPKGPSAGHDVGSGTADVGKGAAKGAGNIAAGAGKGAGDLVTLHPINAAGAVGTGAAKGGTNIAKGTAKGTGKIVKGTGKAIKKIF